MWIKNIVKKLYFLQNIPKTLYVNFTALPFNQARRLPIYCGRRTKILGLRRGSIVLDGEITRGMISLCLDGIRGSGMGSKKHKDSYISFEHGAKLIFHGKAGFACGDTIMLAKDAEFVIGSDFSTNVLCNFFVSRRVTFGDDCFCGWSVSVRDGDGHYIVDYGTGEKLNPPKEILIGSHVWLASDVTVLKGVTIADDCVVACNSLVTKPLTESHAIYGGNPARRIKSGVSFIKDGHGYGEG